VSAILDWQISCLGKCDGASPNLLNDLKNAASVELPSEYIELLQFSNGGEWDIEAQPCYFIAYCAEEVADAAKYGEYEEFFSGFVVIGDNGAGEFIALDVRGIKPWPIVALDKTNIDLNETVLLVAPDFESFLCQFGKVSAKCK